jgi:hypothetical protein
MKSIKNLIKIVAISGIVVMFNITPSFASDKVETINDFCNKYGIVNNGKIDNERLYGINTETKENGDSIIKYSNGSWSLYNIKANKYIFKPLESNENLVCNNIDDLSKCSLAYTEIKNDHLNIELGAHSNIIYADNLNTNQDLENYAKQWLKDTYNITLDIPIYYNNITDKDGVTINGLYNYKTYKDKYTPISIEINQGNIDIQKEKYIIHEMTHYALDKLDKPSKDSDTIFEKECIKNGGDTNYGGIGLLHSHLKSTL